MKPKKGVIEKPYSMQLELTYGCNRRCWFCGIHDTPRNEFHYMDFEVAKAVAQECAIWKPKMRMEFGTGGEPPLNPRFFDIVNILRTECPGMQIMVQTNVESWAIDRQSANTWIGEWFKSGGNFLVLNCYKEGLKTQMEDWMKGQPWEVIDFYNDNPAHHSMYHYISSKVQRIFLCEDLGLMTLENKTAKVSQRWLNNQGGSTPPRSMLRAGIDVLTTPLHKRCTQPFRQLVLSFDGSAPLCCYDWVDRYVVGQFPDQSLQEIWEGRPMQIARQLLYVGNRNNHPCLTCDFHGGFRMGIINDPDLPETEAELEEEMRKIVTEQMKVFKPHQIQAIERMQKVRKEYQTE